MTLRPAPGCCATPLGCGRATRWRGSRGRTPSPAARCSRNCDWPPPKRSWRWRSRSASTPRRSRSCGPCSWSIPSGKGSELANGLRELVTLPLTLETPCGLAHPFRRGSTRGLDRIGGRTEFVAATCATAAAWPAAYAACRAPPRKFLAAPIAWPPAARDCIIVTSPHTQARRARSLRVVMGHQAEPTRRGEGRALSTTPPKEQGDGDPNQ